MSYRSYRLVICLDVDGVDLADAYSKVYKAMTKLPTGFCWESSDEAYDPDGNAIDPDELSRTRTVFLANHNPIFDD